ncbi:MAG: hypothetical protein GX131_15540 [candidate division WS1 bacterium]|nr:hypothetical protein [candidate division WS1 bacterium]
MPASGAGGLIVTEQHATVEELGRLEHDAIVAQDWERLEGLLDRQRDLWRQLAAVANLRDGSEEAGAAAEALRVLYETRRRNHALLERSFNDLRRKLVTAHTGTEARSAYRSVA